MNRELTRWSGIYGLPRFDLIQDDDFSAGMDKALADADAEIEAIATNPEPATFENTVAALEVADTSLNNLCAVFYTLTGVDSNDKREALSREFAPKLAAYSSKVGMDKRLYDRVVDVSEGMDTLAPEDRRITELALRNFRRAGADLTGANRKHMAQIRQRLAVLYTDFGQNVLADERDFVMPVADDRLAGLPAWLITSMKAAAKERGLSGQIVTLNRSLIVPFLQYSDERDLRETAWRAWVARGSGQGAGGDRTDNTDIIREILALRHERAGLLGYESFAAYKLEPEMAGSPERVEALLSEVWKAAKERTDKDSAQLKQMLQEDGINADLSPWDWRYYAERKRQLEHDLDEAEVKPYLTLDSMLGAVFDVANRLFGLTFEEIEAPLWSADTCAWRIMRGDNEMAIFIGDYFARPSKRSGAWCSALRSQHKVGAGQRAIVINVCNFTPPAENGAPSFLSWDDAHTLFHEFGHALHHILSDVNWPSISGTSVARDFVELPSQLYEHWLEQPEVLDKHARHAETGKALPVDLRDRIIAAGNTDQGFATLEYLQSALVDLALHSGTPPADPIGRQKEILAGLGAPAVIPMRHASPHFSHAFSGDGYSSGYYSYLWSEVMDADAFEAFRETGDIFNAEMAQKLEAEILSRGGSLPADQLWTRFRERMPGVEPLLKGRGLV